MHEENLRKKQEEKARKVQEKARKAEERAKIQQERKRKQTVNTRKQKKKHVDTAAEMESSEVAETSNVTHSEVIDF